MGNLMFAFQNRPKELGGLQIVQIPKPKAQIGEVLVKIEAWGLNFRDYRMVEGTYTFNYRTDTVLGSDACGTVVSIGQGVSQDWLGKSVIINPIQHWGADFNLPANGFGILGSPDDGVFCEYFAIKISAVYERPKHLQNIEAAALPLAGVTAYRALFTKGAIKPGDYVLVTGASGGVAQMAIAFAVAIGAKVYVSSSSEENIEHAKSFGALGGVNYRTNDMGVFFAAHNLKFNCIIDAAGGNQTNQLLSLMQPMGKLVLYGAMNGKCQDFDLFTLYYNQLQILGTLVGNNTEFEEMINLVIKHKIHPVIDSVFPFRDLEVGLSKLSSRNHFGKIVLSI